MSTPDASSPPKKKLFTPPVKAAAKKPRRAPRRAVHSSSPPRTGRHHGRRSRSPRGRHLSKSPPKKNPYVRIATVRNGVRKIGRASRMVVGRDGMRRRRYLTPSEERAAEKYYGPIPVVEAKRGRGMKALGGPAVSSVALASAVSAPPTAADLALLGGSNATASSPGTEAAVAATPAFDLQKAAFEASRFAGRNAAGRKTNKTSAAKTREVAKSSGKTRESGKRREGGGFAPPRMSHAAVDYINGLRAENACLRRQLGQA